MTDLTNIEIGVAAVADAMAAAEVHREAATRAYATIFPPSSPPPTAEGLAPGWRALIVDAASTVLVARRTSGAGLSHRGPGPEGPAPPGPEQPGPAGAVVGVAALRPEPDVPSGLLLARLYVRSDHWGLGLGSQLHDRILAVAADEADAINLWVLERNDRARRLYERWGWELVPGRYLANDPPEIRDVLYRRRLSGHPGPRQPAAPRHHTRSSATTRPILRAWSIHRWPVYEYWKPQPASPDRMPVACWPCWGPRS